METGTSISRRKVDFRVSFSFGDRILVKCVSAHGGCLGTDRR